MLTLAEFSKLAHDIKRAAKILSFIRDEMDHEKQKVMISLMADEMDRLFADLEDIKEKLPNNQE